LSLLLIVAFTVLYSATPTPKQTTLTADYPAWLPAKPDRDA